VVERPILKHENYNVLDLWHRHRLLHREDLSLTIMASGQNSLTLA
jgi:hypothetical protein